jgi:hypothetical protein
MVFLQFKFLKNDAKQKSIGTYAAPPCLSLRLGVSARSSIFPESFRIQDIDLVWPEDHIHKCDTTPAKCVGSFVGGVQERATSLAILPIIESLSDNLATEASKVIAEERAYNP